MHDVTPELAEAHNQIRHDWFETCRLSGFQPVEVPPVGFADTFTAGHHAAGERTYHFPDRAGRELALVSDSLPSLLRLTAGRKAVDQRIAHCTPVFRYERRPRRHFHHLGLMEVHFRRLTPPEHQAATARLLFTLADFLTGRLNFTVTLSNPGLWRGLIASGTASPELSGVLNRLRTAHASQRPSLLHESGADDAAVLLAEQLVAAPSGAELLRNGGPASEQVAACHSLAEQLRARGMNAIIDLSELHASEFHDSTAFLLRPDNEPRLLGDGGSYGAFAEAFIGTPTSLHSAVIGLERLADLQGPKVAVPPAVIALLAEPHDEMIKIADSICRELRGQGIAVWDVLISKPLRQHLRDFARLGVPYSVLIGERELADSLLTIRDQDGRHHRVARTDLAGWLATQANGRT
ncbi:ATP phosphoribosyltransferase regulatory subunit [Streptosporangium sp. NBC_01810]|uniref:ATP phosphoribosyltransferase regulatory subunit n=1 Tax=Streptosporangium sp. NBC_01810 TaxID=2975951 RepID=UPI002DD9F97A|nr:ATP phosphoribosyltransferase regulatory subunit [Streptosporangium sp. NBC_01810]WSA24018.1 ATP phosphoribosyltransferase regulatory subunit [Streptosporangium sp. NBC_01810]